MYFVVFSLGKLQDIIGICQAFENSAADGKLCSIGYCYECYGIIVNEDLLAKAGYQLSDITNFETLKATPAPPSWASTPSPPPP